MQTKRKCSKGYSCGKSCINIKRVCRKALAGQSVSIANRLSKLVDTATRAPFEINPVKPESLNVSIGDVTGSDTMMTSNSVVNTADGDIPISAYALKSGGFWSIGFKVNNSYAANKNNKYSPEDRKLISKTINYDVQRILQSLPDNSMLQSEPYDLDGRQKARARMYEKFGFGKIDSIGFQQALKFMGTIKPLV